MALSDKHVQMNLTDSANNNIKVYPRNTTEDVIVKPTNNIPEDATDMNKVLSKMGALAFQNSITIPPATTETYGVTKLSNETNNVSSTSESTAATTKALSTVAQGSVKNTGDETINGIKTFANGIKIGNASIEYNQAEKAIIIGFE